MTTIALLFVLGSFFLISFKGTNEIIEENTKLTEYEEPFDEFSEFDYEAIEGQAKLISSHQGKTIEDYLVKQPISNKPTYTPSISKIAWEAPESLVKKGTYTKFLQMTGKTIKLNLQNDLLLVNDIPTNKFVKVDIKIASNGDVNSIKIASSSGSELIDNSIKKVVNETLKYMRPPSLGIISKSADITLTLELN